MWTQPSCPACGYQGPDFMYLPPGDQPCAVLVQDQRSLSLRVITCPNVRDADPLPEAEAIRAWAQRVAVFADPPLAPTERVVSIAEYMAAAIHTEPTGAELPCPSCRSHLYWHCTGLGWPRRRPRNVRGAQVI